MPEVLMPRLVEHMEQGVVARWLRVDGEEIEVGDDLVEIETDKATTVVEAEHGGLLSILAAEGSSVRVGEPIAVLGTGSEAKDGVGSSGNGATAGLSVELETPRGVVDSEPGANGAGTETATRHRASPVARRIASERGLDVGAIAGSGPHGKVLKVDVLGMIGGRAPAGAAAAAGPVALAQPAAAELSTPATRVPHAPAVDVPHAPAVDVSQAVAVDASHAPAVDASHALAVDVSSGPAERARGVESVEPVSPVQRTIARRMAEARATIPSFEVSIEIDMSRCLHIREEWRAEVDADSPLPSINDFIVKACARALRAYPRANGCYRDEAFVTHSRVNIGVAVAAEGSLVVPTVFDADRLGLGEIARETRRLATLVRSGEIAPSQLAGGTFTVSNLGMFGVSTFTAIVNPPQACILAVGSVVERPVMLDGEVVGRPMVTMTLASDHRIIYGADAAKLLGLVRENLERPLSMAL
jgi:pyruvate dehydrogenase E2 component (dihydrolipoamide acetyltransferase)